VLTNSTDLILCSQRQPRVCRSKSGWSGEGREVQFCQFEHLRAHIGKTDNGCVVGPGETMITGPILQIRAPRYPNLQNRSMVGGLEWEGDSVLQI